MLRVAAYFLHFGALSAKFGLGVELANEVAGVAAIRDFAEFGDVGEASRAAGLLLQNTTKVRGFHQRQHHEVLQAEVAVVTSDPTRRVSFLPVSRGRSREASWACLRPLGACVSPSSAEVLIAVHTQRVSHRALFVPVSVFPLRSAIFNLPRISRRLTPAVDALPLLFVLVDFIEGVLRSFQGGDSPHFGHLLQRMLHVLEGLHGFPFPVLPLLRPLSVVVPSWRGIEDGPQQPRHLLVDGFLVEL
mmetsp:Transcript_20369/g.40799  ORF Transcript_20369/g.40799 Transcript_20369/m.40799 type:complete len:246 (-) Transcript_20369:579-1316(-)